jgi:hypothetical protein
MSDGIGCCCAAEICVATRELQRNAMGQWVIPPFLHVAFSHNLTGQLSGITSDVDLMNELVSIRSGSHARSVCSHGVRTECQHSSGNTIQSVRCVQEMEDLAPE